MPPLARYDGGLGWLESRDDDVSWHSNLNSSTVQSATNQTITQQMLLNDLKYSAAKSIRTSTIILATFNMVAAFATAVGILCDTYFRARRNNQRFNFKRNAFNFVPGAEVYPLVLSFAILIQSATFVGAQSTGLDSLFGRGCTTLAQLMLPAVFIVPYTQMVFGLEIAARALRKQPFIPRGKYHTSVCLAIVGLLTLATFLVAIFDRSADFCLTSLFWFVAHYSVVCFALLVAITVIVLVCIAVISVKLYRSINVEVTARVSASRMVYYLALAVISNGFMLPFFFVLAFINRRSQTNALTLSMVASVVANLSGLMTGGLYLFLKSSTQSAISPNDKVGEYEERLAKYKMRRYESNDSDDEDDSDDLAMHPGAGSKSHHRMDSEASLISIKKEEEVLGGMSTARISMTKGRRSPDSILPDKLISAAAALGMPKAPVPARVPSQKGSYSLFPRNTLGPKSSGMLLPATTYSPFDKLKPPPSMANLAQFRHRRDSSLVSSATVQIGLRLSSVDDISPLVKSSVAANDNEVYSLNCPNASLETETRAPKRPVGVDSGAVTTLPPLQVPDRSSGRDPVKDAKMKTLPPVPRIDGQTSVTKADTAAESEPESEITLSPSVYTLSTPTKAKAKLPSPKGVGFSMPTPKSASPRSPPRRRGTGESIPLPAGAGARREWI